MANRSKAKGTGRRSHQTGMVGEGRFISFAASKGWDVYRGLDGHTSCDFIADTPAGLLRVEVKRIESIRLSQRGYYYIVVTKLQHGNYDVLFVSTPMGDYLIPSDRCPLHSLSLKYQSSPEAYKRNIVRPGKYEVFRVE